MSRATSPRRLWRTVLSVAGIVAMLSPVLSMVSPAVAQVSKDTVPVAGVVAVEPNHEGVKGVALTMTVNRLADGRWQSVSEGGNIPLESRVKICIESSRTGYFKLYDRTGGELKDSRQLFPIPDDTATKAGITLRDPDRDTAIKAGEKRCLGGGDNYSYAIQKPSGKWNYYVHWTPSQSALPEDGDTVSFDSKLASKSGLKSKPVEGPYVSREFRYEIPD